MTLTEAREWVRQFGRDTAGSSTAYSDTMIDRSILVIGDDFIEHTHCTRTTSSLALTASSEDLPAFPSGFRPEQFIRAWIAGEGPVVAVDHPTLMKKQADETEEGVPEFFAFTSLTAGEVHRIPDDDYTLSLEWWQRLTTFTPGTPTPDSVSLNVPDHFFRQAMLYGAPALLQHNDIEHAFASSTWRKYLEYRESVRQRAGILPARLSQSHSILETER